MRKTFSTALTLFVGIGGLMVQTALAQRNSVMSKQGGEKHPKIRQAINTLQNAMADLQNAAHDFCGHRVKT